ncbi:thiamine pyrophosphate-binding protein [bacterium]|nr:thiamine pyrophosphate-binding protein [bacterium]
MMMKKEECLRAIAARRTDEVVITTMGVAGPWASLSDHERDFASVDSGMGHAADFGLGVALARPDLKVVVLNGDGSMLMSLGTLVTVVDSGVRNLILFVVENRTYEVTGNQPVPGGGRFNFAEMARGAGFGRIYEFRELEALKRGLPEVLSGEGPVFATLFVEPGSEGPPKRQEGNPLRYLRDTIAGSAHRLREVLGRGR